MTYQFADEPEQPPKTPSRRWTLVAAVAVLATMGIGSAILWHAYSRDIIAANPAGGSEPAEKPLSLMDFQAFQQQIVQSMRSTEQLLAAQQAEIKRLSDQLTLLSGKVDLLQGPAASVQDAIPLTAPHPAMRVPRKKLAPKPTGAISTGGAPLPPPDQSNR